MPLHIRAFKCDETEQKNLKALLEALSKITGKIYLQSLELFVSPTDINAPLINFTLTEKMMTLVNSVIEKSAETLENVSVLPGSDAPQGFIDLCTKFKKGGKKPANLDFRNIELAKLSNEDDQITNALGNINASGLALGHNFDVTNPDLYAKYLQKLVENTNISGANSSLTGLSLGTPGNKDVSTATPTQKDQAIKSLVGNAQKYGVKEGVSTLTELNIFCNSLDRNYGSHGEAYLFSAAIADMLKFNKGNDPEYRSGLQKLNIVYDIMAFYETTDEGIQQLPTAAFEALLESIKANQASLKHFSLNCLLSSEQFLLLSKALESCEALTHVCLGTMDMNTPSPETDKNMAKAIECLFSETSKITHFSILPDRCGSKACLDKMGELLLEKEKDDTTAVKQLIMASSMMKGETDFSNDDPFCKYLSEAKHLEQLEFDISQLGMNGGEKTPIAYSQKLCTAIKQNEKLVHFHAYVTDYLGNQAGNKKAKELSDEMKKLSSERYCQKLEGTKISIKNNNQPEEINKNIVKKPIKNKIPKIFKTKAALFGDPNDNLKHSFETLVSKCASEQNSQLQNTYSLSTYHLYNKFIAIDMTPALVVNPKDIADLKHDVQLLHKQPGSFPNDDKINLKSLKQIAENEYNNKIGATRLNSFLENCVNPNGKYTETLKNDVKKLEINLDTLSEDNKPFILKTANGNFYGIEDQVCLNNVLATMRSSVNRLLEYFASYVNKMQEIQNDTAKKSFSFFERFRHGDKGIERAKASVEKYIAAISADIEKITLSGKPTKELCSKALDNLLYFQSKVIESHSGLRETDFSFKRHLRCWHKETYDYVESVKTSEINASTPVCNFTDDVRTKMEDYTADYNRHEDYQKSGHTLR